MPEPAFAQPSGMPAAGIRRVLVIGSGPIVIGQAAEFDYSGTQACRALGEAGVETVLVNSNPATIMTDPEVGGRVYLEPLEARRLEEVIRAERPDGLLAGFGGQTGLNLARELSQSGVLERWGVRLLGTPLEAIEKAEDRAAFRQAMLELGMAIPPSRPVRSLDEARAWAREHGLPLVVRPAYTLGGTGGGLAATAAEMEALVERGLTLSPVGEVLLEESIWGWREIEYEVLRDRDGSCVAICSMENVDPVGIHTGDSVVVAPAQTLTDPEHQALRQAAFRIVEALGIVGACNVQFAVAPQGQPFAFRVIEVNPRVSRSSALASKATGYPIAQVAAKLALGLRLGEVRNPITGTSACFEPALDYVVLKVPRWPFDKFPLAERELGTQMQATGEAMAIDRSFEGAFGKALRSLDQGPVLARAVRELERLRAEAGPERAREAALAPREGRLQRLVAAFALGLTLEEARPTGIDPFFLRRLRRLGGVVARVRAAGPALEAGLLAEAKRAGLGDGELAELTGLAEREVRRRREAAGLEPGFLEVDSCAGEFPARTPYFYSTHFRPRFATAAGGWGREGEAEAAAGERAPAVLVVGAGPIRIGQGIEFDYSAVQAVQALQRAGYRAVIVNNNPETVSTDFDVADALYFEPLTAEDVLAVARRERVVGALVQFGGQTALDMAAALEAEGLPALGTPQAAIERAEDRELCGRWLRALGVRQPAGAAARSPEEARELARRLGFPLMLRPSFVLGGRGMSVVREPEAFERWLEEARRAHPGAPVLLDRYLEGRELEVDAVTDGEATLIPAVMEHVERAGVHSGDSVALLPAALEPEALAELVEVTRRIGASLGLRGLFNVQFVLHRGELYVLEVNPRASRTVPFVSKATGVPLVELAIRAALGRPLRAAAAALGLEKADGLLPPPPVVAAKAPVFSTGKVRRAEVAVGPEMRSTGEVLGFGRSRGEALARALQAAGLLPPRRALLLSAPPALRAALAERARRLGRLGFRLCATPGTAERLRAAGLEVEALGYGEALAALAEGRLGGVVDLPRQGFDPARPGFGLRRATVEFGLPCYTALETVDALAEALQALDAGLVRGVWRLRRQGPPVRAGAEAELLPRQAKSGG
ncbi:MAG: carbamoyl-phosphate synthase large subunit [Bacillota bacterium]|nr:carbamoyl-phosphate synthase large subunit [Bacillota bacterium]